MSKYSEKQVSDKIEEAVRFLADAKAPENKYTKLNDLHGALQCISSAYNMLSDILFYLRTQHDT